MNKEKRGSKRIPWQIIIFLALLCVGEGLTQLLGFSEGVGIVVVFAVTSLASVRLM